jgi:hypothetical protein
VTGETLPHITQMLEATGHVDSTWFTAEARDRGTAVHRLCADLDHEALEPSDLDEKDPYRNYLLAYAQALQIIRPTILDIEVPAVHVVHRYGGRPDRRAIVYGLQAVLEIKSGDPEKAHPIQCALQAILVAPELQLPPEVIGRFALYLKPTGKWKLEYFTRRRDFDVARQVIRECCRA